MIFGTLPRRSMASSREPCTPVTRVSLRGVSEGEHFRDDVADVLGGLPKAHVEFAARPASHVRDDPVEGRPVLLILVDAHVDVLSQEATALRSTHGVGVIYGTSQRVPSCNWSVFQERDRVAHGDEPQSDDPAASGGVDQLVNPSRIETGGHVDVAVLRFHVLIFDPNEGPLAPVNGYGGTVGQVPHRQGCLSFIRVGGRIGQVLPVCQQENLGGFVALELAHDLAGQRPLGADSFRALQSDESWRGRDVGLPAAPDHRVAPSHQVAVAGLQWQSGVGGNGGAVHGQGGLPAPVHHVEQDAAVAPIDVHRLERGEVCGELHLAGEIAGRQVEVGNSLIPGVRRVYRIVGRAFEEFVRAHIAEALASRKTGAIGDFQVCNCQDASGRPVPDQ